MEPVLAVIDRKRFGADLPVGADESWLGEAMDAVCGKILDKRVAVDLVADLGWEGKEGEPSRRVLRSCQLRSLSSERVVWLAW